MITINNYITNNRRPVLVRSERVFCDECQCECLPESTDPRAWLFGYKGQQLCWECFMCESGAEIIE